MARSGRSGSPAEPALIRRGDLYWVSAPDGKTRPALIISVTRRNQRAGDVVVIPCSTQLRFGPWHVPLAKREAGLPAPSVVRCEELYTVRHATLGGRIGGPLSQARLAEVAAAIASALGFDGDVD